MRRSSPVFPARPDIPSAERRLHYGIAVHSTAREETPWRRRSPTQSRQATMKHQFTVSTRARVQFIDITDRVQEAVRESGVRSGVVHVFVPHTTAGITINENADPSVVTDVLAALERAVPRDAAYEHSEGNSPAHVKASIMGFCQTLLVEDGSLLLGTWQAVYFCEFDGPRTRRVVVKVQPDGQ
jgi:secondary thiamine-phosphate synthase enzyme